MPTFKIIVLDPIMLDGALVSIQESHVTAFSKGYRLFIPCKLLTEKQRNLLVNLGEQEVFILSCQVEGRKCKDITRFEKAIPQPQLA